MDRKQVVGRKNFWWNQKKKMLAKSDGKCSHCGVSIDIKGMTVEHVIPLSKGGTNDLSNTVALCPYCNKIKRNYVTEPQFFYSYLKDEYKEELEVVYKKFLEEFEWVSLKSYFENDVFNFDIEEILSDGSDKLSRADRRKLKLDSAKLQKTVVSLDTRDYDIILDFCEKYGKRVLGLKEVKPNKSEIYEYLRDYAIYGVKSGSGYSGLVFIRPEIVGFYEVNLVVEMLPLYESCAVYLSQLWLRLFMSLSRKNTLTTVLITPKDSKVFEVIHSVMPSYKDSVKVVGDNKVFRVSTGEGKDFCIEKFGNIFIGRLPKNYNKYLNSSSRGKNLLRFKEWLKFSIIQSFPLSYKVVNAWSFTQCILGDEEKAYEAEITQIYGASRSAYILMVVFGLLSLLLLGYSSVWLFSMILYFSIIFLSTLYRVIREDERHSRMVKSRGYDNLDC